MSIIEYPNSKELWKKYQVRGTPTIVLVNSTSGRSVKLEGLATGPQITAGLARLRQGHKSKTGGTK